MTPPSFSAGDMITGLLALVAIATFLFERFRRVEDKAILEGGNDAAITVRVEGLDQLMKAQMAALTTLVERVHHHEVDDANFHGEMRTEVGAVKEQLQGVNRRLDQLGAQIGNLVFVPKST